MAWWSACTELENRQSLCLVQVVWVGSAAPAVVLSHRSTPPTYTASGLLGDTAAIKSYQAWPRVKSNVGSAAVAPGRASTVQVSPLSSERYMSSSPLLVVD